MMKTEMQKYSDYKDSGLKWLGEIPSHWTTKRIKHLFIEINERSFDGSEDLLSVSQYTGVTNKTERLEDGGMLTNASTLEGYKKVWEGDLVSNIMLAWNGSLGFSPFNGITSPAYSIYRLKTNDVNRYFHYLLRTELYKSEFKRNSSGVIESRLRLYTDDFFRIESILPPLPEQTAIAAFLDRKTALIDQAIDIKQKQIELLKERRQILIHKAVTCGLNPNAKMKDSGVEWIGEIPVHWSLKTLKFLKANIKNAFVDGPFGSNLKSEHFIEDGNVYVVESGFITTGVFINKVFKTISEKHYQTIKRSTCNEGDVIIAKIGANYGMAAELPLLDKKAVVSGNSLKITLDNSKILNILFVKLLGLSKTHGGFEEIVNASAQPALSLGGLNNLKLPIAPIDEQPLIAKHIDNIETKFASAISFKGQEIEKLKEYKATLINSAVTGKIKVC